MTFFMIGGIVSVITAVVLILIYLFTHKMDEDAKAPKVIMWIGMLLSVTGAALLTIEYSFPHISHPKKPSVYDHFVEYLGNQHIIYMQDYLGYEVDGIINVSHKEIFSTEENETYIKLYDTTIIYSYDSEPWKYSMVNKYEYNKDYSYQNLVQYNYAN